MKIGFKKKMTGMLGEDAAVTYLKKHKYKIIERNYRNKMGEIDIIAREKEDLVFVEVKTRSNAEFGTPAQAITYYKKRNMINTAKWYIAENKIDLNVRFDVVEVYGKFTGNSFELENINHIKYAILEA